MRKLNQDIYRCLLTNLLEIQRVSFCWFLEKGLLQELENFTAIRDYLGELELSLSAKQYKIKHSQLSKYNEHYYNIFICIDVIYTKKLN